MAPQDDSHARIVRRHPVSVPLSRRILGRVIARSLVVIAFVLVGLAFAARPSVACSCSYGPTDGPAIAEFSDIVFTGIASAYGALYPVEYSIAVEFRVGTVYKGIVPPRVQVRAIGGNGPSGGVGPGCEYGFQLGRLYTVFARYHESDGVPDTNGCFWNVEGPIAAATYGLPAGGAPEADGEAGQLALVAAVALAVLAVISVALRPRRVTP
jgi:hypothetical protein